MSTITTLDSTKVGAVYPRLDTLNIKHVSEYFFEVTVSWQPHIRSEAGEKMAVGSVQTTSFNVTQDNLTERLSLRDATTGQLLQTSITYGALVCGGYTAWIEHAGLANGLF